MTDSSDQRRPTPREFLKGRRPDEFSDSAGQAERPTIQRELLEFVLAEITRTKREYDFETFSYHLMRREICPNLSPQAGPVGGGDSHADAASYEVSGDLDYRYWSGVSTTTSRRFAFAFSAKKDWSTKIRGDVAKLMKWPVPPSVVCFVTNQHVSDRSKKKMVDELRAAHGVEVQIFDRSWIVAKVLENDGAELVYAHLHVERPTGQTAAVAGPNDAQRRVRLDELKVRLANPVESFGARVSYMMADEYLEAAVLSRELERPRAETAALFAQAIAVARDVGVARQIHRAIYQRAWTEYWYFEDPNAAWSSYPELVAATSGSVDVGDWERVATVVTLLLTASRAGTLRDGTPEELAERTASLDSVFAGLETAQAGSTTGWRATCARVLQRIINEPHDDGLRRQGLKRVFDIIEKHGQRPDMPTRRYLEQASIFIGMDDPDTDDELFARMHKISVERTTATESGRLFLRRAFDAVRLERWKSVLRFSAEARDLLWKNETQSEALQATLLLSRSYHQLGLPHAATLEAVLACSRAEKLAHDIGVPDKRTILAYAARLESELTIGACSSAGETGAILLGVVRAFPNAVSKGYLEGLDWHLACALLAERCVVPASLLVRLGDLFLTGEKTFMRSALAAHIAAGEVRDFVDHGMDIADAESQFLESDELRERLAATRARDATVAAGTTYVGHVLGLPIHVEATGARQQIVGLALLGAIEAFAAAASRRDLTPWPQSLHISVVAAPEGGVRIETASTTRAPKYRLSVAVPDAAGAADAESDAVFQLAAETVGNTFWTDAERLERVAGFQRGVARARVLIETAMKLLPTAPVIEIGPARVPWWKKYEELLVVRPASPTTEPASASDPRPPSPEEERHAGENLAIISIPQWDAAKWRGVAYPMDPNLKPPELALIFADGAAAVELFRGLREVVGAEDPGHRVAVGLINDEHSSDYHVVVTGNIDAIAPAAHNMFFTNVARGMKVKLSDPRPRAWFLDAFQREKSFRLVPVVMSKAGVQLVDQEGVVCHVLHHGKLSEIGGHAAMMFGSVIEQNADEE
jgi:hypothetical protein